MWDKYFIQLTYLGQITSKRVRMVKKVTSKWLASLGATLLKMGGLPEIMKLYIIRAVVSTNSSAGINGQFFFNSHISIF